MVHIACVCVFGLIVLIQCDLSQLGGATVSISGNEGVSEGFWQRDTATTFYSAGSFLKCHSDLHVTPTSTEEVSELIKLHTSSNKPIKIRATHRGFHSSAGFVCSGGRSSTKLDETSDLNLIIADDGEGGITSLTVLLHLMNRVISVDAKHKMLTVEAGMVLINLVDAAETHNMSVLAGALSYYGNLTIGGVISSSAHGSGLGTKSSLGDLVTKVKWVNAKGDIIVSDPQTEAGAREMKALVGGLGLLGIITEVTFQLEASSRTIVEMRNAVDDSNIADDLKKMLNLETPHIYGLWRPDLGTYRALLFTNVRSEEALPATAPEFDPNAKAALADPVDDQIAGAMSEMLADWGGDMAGESDTADDLNAAACSAGIAGLKNPYFKDGNGTPVDHTTMPTNHAAVLVDCSPKCPHQPGHMGAFLEDNGFAIKMSEFGEWVQDVKAIVKAELAETEGRLNKRYGKGKVKSCLPPGYFWLRFGRGSENFLSTNTGTEDVAYVQWAIMTSAFTPRKPGRHATISETIEQLTLCKYRARPHWGKNHERTFRHPTCHVRDNYPASNFEQMIELQQHHDPNKIFEPILFSHVLQKNGPDYTPLCTLQFWCYCYNNKHCPQDHACEPSPIFPDYKVCKLIHSVNKNDDEL